MLASAVFRNSIIFTLVLSFLPPCSFAAETMNTFMMDFLLLDSLHAFLKRGMPEPIHWEKERAALRAQLVLTKP